MLMRGFDRLRQFQDSLLSVRQRKAYLGHLQQSETMPDAILHQEQQRLDREEGSLRSRIAKESKHLKQIYNGYEHEKD